jgi:hypothetical protein
MMFRILLGIDIVAAAIVGYFFLAGLADGSISAFNIQLWIGLLLALTLIFGAGLALRRAGRPAWGSLVLAVLAVPTALYGLFLLAVIVSGARWN